MNTPLKWHGGKRYLARQLVNMMPRHIHYVEPYAGGLSVLLAKDPEVSEVINDLDGSVMNFWDVLRDPYTFCTLNRRLAFTPVSERDYEDASAYMLSPPADKVLWAWAFFVQVRQSLAARRDQFSPLSRTRTRRGMNEQASSWLSAIDGLPEVHDRLKRVVILNRDALEVIRTQDGPDTLFYLDPPYHPETRTSPEVYKREADVAHHQALLALLPKCKGKWMLSGYRSAMYDVWAEEHGYTRHDFELPNHAAGGMEKRRVVECVWCNF